VAARPFSVALILLLSLSPLVVRAERPVRFIILTLLLVSAYLVVSMAALVADYAMLPLVGPILGWSFSTTGLLVHHWEQNRRQRVHLQQVEVSKQRFTDMLVHDLRNRISVTQMNLRSLAPVVREKQPVYAGLADMAEASLQRMLVEVNSLLDIRKMEEGSLRLVREEVEVTALLEEVARDYGVAASASEVTLKVRADPGPLLIRADRVLVSRLLGNLLFNALQHVRVGSEVALSARGRDNEVRISVGNAGPVLTAEQREGLFRPFLALAKDTRAKGTGLGLTLCKLVAEAHGGSIEVESPWAEIGEGVIVHICLPALNTVDESSIKPQ
jgi:cell cycle sensor histidine kinase DivJ